MTIPLHEIVENAWRILQLGGGIAEFSLATVKLPVDVGYGQVRLATDEQGRLAVLVPVETGVRLAPFASAQGVSIATSQYMVSGKPQSFIQMSCVMDELEDVFLSLIDDVLRRLVSGCGPDQAINDAIAEFRGLLSRGADASLESLLGLFGELHFLVELLLVNRNAALAWTGPLGQRYDFSSSAICAEIKSTLRGRDSVVTISGIEQLELPVDGRDLVLVRTIAERAGSGGSTIAELISAAYENSADSAILDRALATAGLSQWRSISNFSSERFSLLRREMYSIDQNFPRLSVESFAPGHPLPGVQGIKYELDLAHARQHRLSEESAERLIRAIAQAI